MPVETGCEVVSQRLDNATLVGVTLLLQLCRVCLPHSHASSVALALAVFYPPICIHNILPTRVTTHLQVKFNPFYLSGVPRTHPCLIAFVSLPQIPRYLWWAGGFFFFCWQAFVAETPAFPNPTSLHVLFLPPTLETLPPSPQDTVAHTPCRCTWVSWPGSSSTHLVLIPGPSKPGLLPYLPHWSPTFPFSTLTEAVELNVANYPPWHSILTRQTVTRHAHGC